MHRSTPSTQRKPVNRRVAVKTRHRESHPAGRRHPVAAQHDNIVSSSRVAAKRSIHTVSSSQPRHNRAHQPNASYNLAKHASTDIKTHSLYARMFSTSTPANQSPAATTTTTTTTTPFQSMLKRLRLSSAKDIELTVEEQQNYNRWKVVPAAIFTHASLGSIFAWSIFNQPLMFIDGVIEQTASDWTLGQVMPVFSTTMSCFGLTSFLFGRAGLNEKLGPRATTLLGGTGFAGAFALSSFATATHNLPLLYAAYGLLAGTSVGSAYVGPIATLMRWFPDKKGLASAIAVAGFGSGAVFAAQFIERLLGIFRKLPQYVGPTDAYPTRRVDGKLLAMIDGKEQEVVIATEHSLKRLGAAAEHLQQGLYLVGTGDVGISQTFLALGALYSLLIATSAFVFRLPNERYDPTQPHNIRPLTTPTPTPTPTNKTEEPAAAVQKQPITALQKYDYVAERDVTPKDTLKTRQFWLLWSGLMLNSSSAYCIIGSAKNLVLDVYGSHYPLLITSAFAATFVSIISASNLSGRLGWGAVSDKIGRKRTFDLLWGLSVPFYLGIPLAAHLLVDESLATGGHPSFMPLAVFYGSVCLVISCFGGCASVSPAYLSDLFGPKHAGANAGQLLSYLVVAGYAGPLTFTTMHKYASQQAMEDLVSKIDIVTFTEKFGASPNSLTQLIDDKVVTIPKLLEIAPPGTTDPTPYLYDTIFITLAALQFVGVMLNRGITKVDTTKLTDGSSNNNNDMSKPDNTVVKRDAEVIDATTTTATTPAATTTTTAYQQNEKPQFRLINNMVSPPKFNHVLIRDAVYKAHAQATKFPPTGAAAAAAAAALKPATAQ